MKQFEFFVLRYVPDAVKHECVNFGIAMYETGATVNGFAGVQAARDWRRVRCLDPQADTEMLAAIVADIRQCLVDPAQKDAMLKRLIDSFSNLIEVSPTKGLLAEDGERELRALSTMYLESAIPLLRLPTRGRVAILAQMIDEFERRAILKLLLRDIPIATYTRPGDPMKLDFGYGEGNEFKFLHALSLQSRVDQAVMLAARFPAIASGVKAKNGAEAKLTAVVEDDFDRTREEVGFALTMMEENRIRVATTRELPSIAEEIRLELRA